MIYDTNDVFDFKQNVTFISPKSVSNGCYFIRCFGNNQTPLYIQSPKCKSKQGIVKTGKKMYCDLIFTHEDESFLRWIENFENQCQQILFENRSKWFDSDLEIHDIESSFASSFKIYKSQHLLRANIPLRLGKCALKIYNENEQDIDIETITNNTSLMSILEIQGIKCSSRSFQIDFEIKQMMVLNPVDLFEKCIITKKNTSSKFITNKKKNDLEEILDNSTKVSSIYVSNTQHQSNLEEAEIEDNDNVEKEKKENIEEENKYIEEKEDIEEENKDIEEKENIEEKEKKGDILNLGISNKNELCEIDISIPSIDNEEDIVHLKKRNDVYYEMYSSAKRKAKIARKYALSAYLEAKRIKNTYLLDEILDEDESDNENDNGSEIIDDDIFNLTTKN